MAGASATHLLQNSAFRQSLTILICMIIISTRIVITVTIVIDYFPQLHDPVVYLFATRSLDLIVLKASVVVALQGLLHVSEIYSFLIELSTFFPPPPPPELSVAIAFVGCAC